MSLPESNPRKRPQELDICDANRPTLPWPYDLATPTDRRVLASIQKAQWLVWVVNPK